MGEDTRQITQELRAERHDLERNIDELQQHAKALTDWRTHYRRHTGPSLAVAFSGGVIPGLLAAGSNSIGVRRRASATGYASAAPVAPDRSKARQAGCPKDPGGYPSRTPAGGRRVGTHGRSTRSPSHRPRLSILIGNVVPGFRDEYLAPADRPAMEKSDGGRYICRQLP